jgi:glutaredoxin
MEFFGYPICKDEYADKLKQYVTDKPAFVVSTTYCPYCNKAKSLLEK